MERRRQGGIALKLPFDPATAWGDRERYDVPGSIDGHKVRGKLVSRASGYYLELGPAWCRDERLNVRELARVSLEPEGPQVMSMDDDVASAVRSAPRAYRFFESLSTFYRDNYVVEPVNARARCGLVECSF